jgi:hypothetical protein
MSILRVNTSESSIGLPSADEARGHAQDCPAALGANQHDSAEARAYGAAFVKTLGPGSPTWENLGPLARNGWASRHDQSCVKRHDWRLSWSAVREGWREAGGAFDLVLRATKADVYLTEPIAPARGEHVFDAFGEPAGRVKAARRRLSSCAALCARRVRPIQRDSWPGRLSLRIGRTERAAWLKGLETAEAAGLLQRQSVAWRGPRAGFIQHSEKRCLTVAVGGLN